MRLYEMIYTEEELEQEIRSKEHRRNLYREEVEKNKKLKNDLMQDMKELTKLEQENKMLAEENSKLYERMLVNTDLEKRKEYIEKRKKGVFGKLD